ncbi:MAG TPA: DUF3108 domain-containing protein [Gemmatimonadaceae bacterium]|jgi:hypothetical protein|nr:DUF3108 domain-containing protein [Gemmatimonadaceae bacterium]
MITGLAAIVARLSRTVLPMSLGGTLLLGAPAPSHVTSAPYAKHPFSAMEHAEYDVKYGPIRAGSGTLSVLGIDTVRGRDAYRFRMTLGGGVNLLLYKYALRDTMESWVDTATFTSLRFTQQQWHQGKLRSKHYEIFPERETYRDGTGAEQGSVANPLDDLSLFFFARTIPLTVGSSIDIPRHFKPASNPVVLKVVGRETIDAAGRQWNTIVVQPIIKTSTMFNDGDGRVWLSDDSTRVIVQLNAKASVGSITMKLKSYTPAP